MVRDPDVNRAEVDAHMWRFQKLLTRPLRLPGIAKLRGAMPMPRTLIPKTRYPQRRAAYGKCCTCEGRSGENSQISIEAYYI
jgi:hypothetical protein